MMFSLRLNLQHRQKQITVLKLDSEYLQSALVRTEKRLKGKHQKGLKMLEGDASGYWCLIDWLLAVLGPGWDQHIKAYYSDPNFCRLAEAVDFETINIIDQLLDHSVCQLYQAHQHLRSQRMFTGNMEPSPFLKKLTTRAVKNFMPLIFPEAPHQLKTHRSIEVHHEISA